MITGHITLPNLDDILSKLKFAEIFQTYQQLPEIEKYYNKHNSSIHQLIEDCPNWVDDLSVKLPQDFKNFVSSVIMIPPGQTVPLHLDKHYIVQQKFGAGDTHRYLIFLEDWKSGHYFELDNQPVVSWKAGDWIKFSRDTWHLGGNMGINPFYSAQITVI